MGIDARILVRLKQADAPTEKQLATWSWDLCQAVGARHFWLDAKTGQRAMELAETYSDGRAPGKVYYQDGDDILADPDEWFLNINVTTRYYGEGYERGDLLTLCAVAEWVEANIPNSVVWYGGDSSGVLLEPFDEARRTALRRHLYSQQGRAYFTHETRNTFPTPAPCSLCVPGESRFDRHGWGRGGNYIAVNCAGCGQSFTSHDGGKTWSNNKPE